MDRVTINVDKQQIDVRSHVDEEQRRWYLIEPLLDRLRYTRSNVATIDAVSSCNKKTQLELGFVQPDHRDGDVDDDGGGEIGPTSRFVTIDGLRELLQGIRSPDAARLYTRLFDRLRAMYHEQPRRSSATPLPQRVVVDVPPSSDEVRAAVNALLRSVAANGISLPSSVAVEASSRLDDDIDIVDNARTMTAANPVHVTFGTNATQRSGINETNGGTILNAAGDRVTVSERSPTTTPIPTSPSTTPIPTAPSTTTAPTTTSNTTAVIAFASAPQPTAVTSREAYVQRSIARFRTEMPCLAVFVVRPPAARAYLRVVRARLCHVRSIVSSIRSIRTATGGRCRKRPPTATWKMHATLVYCRAVRCSQYAWLDFCSARTDICDRFRFRCSHTELHVNEDVERRSSLSPITDANIAEFVVRALDESTMNLSSRSYSIDGDRIVANPYRLLGSTDEVIYRDLTETNGDRRIVLTVPDDVLRAMVVRRA